MTKQLEQDSEINKKYASEFIRAARTIQLFTKHADETMSHLSSFLVIFHICSRIIHQKQLIQKAFQQIESNSMG